MTAHATRRTIVFAVAALAGCSQPRRVVTFDLSYDARSRIDQAVRQFAQTDGFTVASAWQSDSAYWPYWALQRGGASIDIRPQHEEPVLAGTPPPRGPIAYAAEIQSFEADEISSSLRRALGSVEGVRNLREE